MVTTLEAHIKFNNFNNVVSLMSELIANTATMNVSYLAGLSFTSR
jgi:hypothetical protein